MIEASLTRRGRVVAAVCVLGVVMAVAVGGRSINAVVVSGSVALLAGYFQVAQLDPPGVRRSPPDDAVVGESRDVSIRFHGERPETDVSPRFVARVSDELDDGLGGPEEPIRTMVGDEPVTYRVRYRSRGEHRIGPTIVEPTDVLGLVTRRMVVDDADAVLAYPEQRSVPVHFRRGLYADVAVGASHQREEFDRLREYARGDALRDVYWPATAKHGEPVVKEFAAETTRRRVSIVGRTAEDETESDVSTLASTIAGRTAEDRAESAADVLASATASLGTALLSDGVPVEMTLPAGEITAEPGPTGRRSLLELTARTGPGTPSIDADPDVLVVADADEARIHTAETTVSFAELQEMTEESRTSPPTAIRGEAEQEV